MEVRTRVIKCQSAPKLKRELMSLKLRQDDSLQEESGVDPKENRSQPSGESVQVFIELGHHAKLRKKPTAEGFTHDWAVTVKGTKGYNLEHFVERVEFHLHESFPNSKRVVRTPPYQVTETGYGGFTFPIYVFLRNNSLPKKIRFQYELFLSVEGSISQSRSEKITFDGPSEFFFNNLLLGGATAPCDDQTICSEAEQAVTVVPPVTVAEVEPRNPVALITQVQRFQVLVAQKHPIYKPDNRKTDTRTTGSNQDRTKSTQQPLKKSNVVSTTTPVVLRQTHKNTAAVNGRKRRIIEVFDESSEIWDDDVHEPQPKQTLMSRDIKPSKAIEVAPLPDSTTVTVRATIEAPPKLRFPTHKSNYISASSVAKSHSNPATTVTSTIHPVEKPVIPTVLVAASKPGRLVVRISSPEMRAADNQLRKHAFECENESQDDDGIQIIPSTDDHSMNYVEVESVAVTPVVAERKRGRPAKGKKVAQTQNLTRGRPKKGAAAALAYAQSVMLPRWVPASPPFEIKPAQQTEEKYPEALVEQKSEMNSFIETQISTVPLLEHKSVLSFDAQPEEKSKLILNSPIKVKKVQPVLSVSSPVKLPPAEVIVETAVEKKSEPWSIEIEARNQTINKTYNVNDFQLLSDCKPLFSSTPIKPASRATIAPDQIVQKSRPRIRFRPRIEELSAMEDAEIIPPHAVLANYIASAAIPSSSSTRGEAVKRPTRRAGINIDELLKLKEREMGVVETTHPVPRFELTAVNRPQPTPLLAIDLNSAPASRLDRSRGVSHFESSKHNDMLPTARVHAPTTIVCAQSSVPYQSNVSTKKSFTTKASMKQFHVDQNQTMSLTKKRRLNKDIEVIDYNNMSGEDKENVNVKKRRVHFSDSISLEKDIQLVTHKHSKPHDATSAPQQPKAAPQNKINPPVLSQPSVTQSITQSATQPTSRLTVPLPVPAPSQAPPMVPHPELPSAAQPRAVNGERVSVLMDLQQRLSTITDLKLLRRIVQIIEETGRYRLNEATFDFDLCKLDLITVNRLLHCLTEGDNEVPVATQ